MPKTKKKLQPLTDATEAAAKAAYSAWIADSNVDPTLNGWELLTPSTRRLWMSMMRVGIEAFVNVAFQEWGKFLESEE